MRSLLPILRTGDLLFFEGKALTSRVIEWSGDCPWSHVGMVVEWKDDEDNKQMGLWEATDRGFPTPCLLPLNPGETTSGVHLTALSYVLEREETLGYLPLRGVTNRQEVERSIAKIVLEEAGKPYEPSYQRIVDSWWDWFGCGYNRVETHSAYFCSELIAATLYTAGLLPAFLNPDGTTQGAHEDHTPSGEWTVANLALTLPQLEQVLYGPLEVHSCSPP